MKFKNKITAESDQMVTLGGGVIFESLLHNGSFSMPFQNHHFSVRNQLWYKVEFGSLKLTYSVIDLLLVSCYNINEIRIYYIL